MTKVDERLVRIEVPGMTYKELDDHLGPICYDHHSHGELAADMKYLDGGKPTDWAWIYYVHGNLDSEKIHYVKIYIDGTREEVNAK